MKATEIFHAPPDNTWLLDAECRELPSTIFITENEEEEKRAKEICNSPCAVKEICLVVNVLNNGIGIFGGMNKRERHNYRYNQLRLARRAAAEEEAVE